MRFNEWRCKKFGHSPRILFISSQNPMIDVVCTRCRNKLFGVVDLSPYKSVGSWEKVKVTKNKD
jgi:hypothetical protein